MMTRLQFVKVCECGCGQPTKLASQSCTREGWIRGQPLRFLNSHARPPSRPAADRFWEKVAITPGCWLWLGCIGKDGYGLFGMGSGETGIRAHRFAYETLIGPIPQDLHLDHVKARGCTHRNCVNPDHLEPVTPRENAMRGDAPAVVLSRENRCKKGHPLTPENTKIGSNGRRTCRICRAAWHHKYDRARRDRRKVGHDVA